QRTTTSRLRRDIKAVLRDKRERFAESQALAALDRCAIADNAGVGRAKCHLAHRPAQALRVYVLPREEYQPEAVAAPEQADLQHTQALRLLLDMHEVGTEVLQHLGQLARVVEVTEGKTLPDGLQTILVPGRALPIQGDRRGGVQVAAPGLGHDHRQIHPPSERVELIPVAWIGIAV